MNNVVLRTKRTMTVSRNATNDVRNDSERLAYGSRPYYAIDLLNTVRNQLGNLIKVVWKLNEVV